MCAFLSYDQFVNVWFVYFLWTVWNLVVGVNISAIDCLERLVSEMTYYLSSGTLTSAQSLTSYRVTCESKYSYHFCAIAKLLVPTDVVLYNYSHIWDIQFNPDKSQEMTLGGSNPCVNLFLDRKAIQLSLIHISEPTRPY